MKKLFLTIVLIAASFCTTAAQVRLPRLVGDNMVLQRDSEVTLWGWAEPQDKVKVSVSWDRSANYSAKADDQGRWEVKVATAQAGGPYTVTIDNGKPLTLRNVLLGEVWICSGQSNMEMPVCGFINQPAEGALDAVLDAARSNAPLRLFTVGRNSVDSPAEDCSTGEWLPLSAESAGSFSAVGYYFGKLLCDVLKIPVGMITTNWGGSPIETWMSEESLHRIEGLDLKAALSGQYENSRPAALYNGMILPLVKYKAKGFVWYQGESNRPNWYDYEKLQVAMVKLWRQVWGDDDMPFYMTQLAPYRYDNAKHRSLALMIEAQVEACRKLPHTAIAGTTDIGQSSCIHPSRKKEVGERLAMLALKNDYNVEGLPLPAPQFEKMTIEKGKAYLSFTNLSDLSSTLSPNSLNLFANRNILSLKCFEVAGADRKFYPARVWYKWWQNIVEVYADEVPEPVAVRYAFCNSPEGPFLTTTYGQPVLPFRTDNWEIPADEIGKIE